MARPPADLEWLLFFSFALFYSFAFCDRMYAILFLANFDHDHAPRQYRINLSICVAGYLPRPYPRYVIF